MREESFSVNGKTASRFWKRDGLKDEFVPLSSIEARPQYLPKNMGISLKARARWSRIRALGMNKWNVSLEGFAISLRVFIVAYQCMKRFDIIFIFLRGNSVHTSAGCVPGQTTRLFHQGDQVRIEQLDIFVSIGRWCACPNAFNIVGGLKNGNQRLFSFQKQWPRLGQD